jgi:multidrug efflux system membrane fusion protein
MKAPRNINKIMVATLTAVALAIVAAVALSASKAIGGTAAPPSASTSSSASVINGVTVVRVDLAAQHSSGLLVEPLNPVQIRGETIAYGTVFDIQPLLDLQTRNDTAALEAESADAAASASRAEVERSRLLYRDEQNISLKNLQASEAGFRADQAKAQAARQNVQALRSSAVLQFGPELARLSFDRQSPAFARLLARQDVLVRITIPPSIATPPPRVNVQTGGGPRIAASLLAAATQVDPGMAGSSFLYRVNASLPSGASIVVHLPVAAGTVQGTFVPLSAVVWFAGQPWVYVQSGPSRFERRPLLKPVEADAGYLVSAGLQAGDRVVIQGAGLLLSEEQRMPAGAGGCKDPECD